MKTWISLLLALLLLCCACLSQAEAMWVLNTGNWNDRLNLREQPDKSAPSLGRYYTGTRVEVLDDLGDWMHVRIAPGLRGSEVTGYMMRSFLEPVKDAYFAGRLPLETLAREETLLDGQRRPLSGGTLAKGTPVYVAGISGAHVHALTMDGEMGYLPKDALEGGLAKPTDAQQMIKEGIGVISGGAQLLLGDKTAAALYGGVCLQDAWLPQGREDAIVFLGEIKGLLKAGSWTWWDNGANCGCEYPVYVQDGMLVEVLGKTADGQLIVRREADAVLEPASSLAGAKRLDNADGSAAIHYAEPLKGEISDEQAIRIAGKALTQHSTMNGWSSARVARSVQPQWGRHFLLLVEFLDEEGAVVETVELNRLTGEVLAIGANG